MLSLANATLVRDIGAQILHNNDFVANSSVAARLRYIADHWTDLGLPAEDVLSGIFLPLNELIRVRDCTKHWSIKAKRSSGLCHDGSSTYEQIAAYSRIGRQAMASSLQQLPTFCETGFNAGHTSSIFLLLGYRVHSFDVAFNSYTPAVANLLSRVWQDRFQLHVGDSRLTLPKWINANKCDVVSVDGLHTPAAVRGDVLSFKRVVSPGATLLVDDTSPNYGRLLNALQRLEQEQIITTPRCTDFGMVATVRGDRPKHFCQSSFRTDSTIG